MKIFGLSIKGNRTRVFGALLLSLGVVQQHIREIVPADYQGWVFVGVGIAVIVLRELTTTPPGQS